MHESYPAFLKFHSQNNCLAYAKFVEPLTNRREHSVLNDVSLGSAFLGNFRLRSCTDANNYCDVQLYGPVPFSHVFLNSVFATLARLEEGEEVILEKIENTVKCTYVEVCPKTENDYTIIAETHANIEVEFLNQVRLVSKNMILPYFVSPGVHVELKIENVVPPSKHPVVLDDNTELHVQTAGAVTSNQDVEKAIGAVVSALSKDAFSHSYAIRIDKPELVARVLPREVVTTWIKNEASLLLPSTIYIAGEEGAHTSNFGIVEVKTDKGDDELPTFSYLYRAPEWRIQSGDVFNKALSHIFSSLKLKGMLHCIDGGTGLEEYTLIRIRGVEEKYIRNLATVQVFIDNNTLDWVREYSNEDHIYEGLAKLTAVHPILLNYTGKKVEISLEERLVTVSLVPVPKDVPNGLARKTCFLVSRMCKIVLKNYHEEESKSDKSTDRDRMFQRPEQPEVKKEVATVLENYGLQNAAHVVHIGSHSAHLHELVSLFEHSEQRAHCLILGPKGCGKTFFLKRLARRLAHNAMVFFSHRLDCSQLKGKAPESVEKILSATLSQLERKQPSVLFLDNFDTLLPSMDLEQRQFGVEKIVYAIARQLRGAEVSTVLTAQRLSSLSHDFLESTVRSRPVVSFKIELDVITSGDRQELLEAWIPGRDTNYEEMAKICDGYSIAELQRLAQIANVESRIRGADNVELQDMKNALEIFVTTKIGNKEKGEVLPSLDDVGGMFVQKSLLEQVILWPKKYGDLFESVGVPVSKGVLLHGPSGCGKTLLANAMISHSKFNVVTVKGPELLSKYIGSSEENVRAVFEKARACAPCILFFDELDSLAPKRGSDSTGVTDRVVNQLLTELDGAEGGMKGVTVLGCTSRIDLIDEALLRPGRFDHHVKCGFPTKEERVAILKVLGKKANVKEDVNFERIAKQTDGWSSADLQLLFTNAQFHISRLQIAAGSADVDAPVEVDDAAIDAVFQNSKPKKRSVVIDRRIGEKLTLA